MGAGASMKKSAPPAEGKENKEISREVRSIIDKEYETYFNNSTEKYTNVYFYRAVCEIVEKLNEKHGNTQLRVPNEKKLMDAYQRKHKKDGKLTKEEFESIIREMISCTELTGYGVKETLIYIFGVPITALFIKNAIMPRVISDQTFLPAITSATALVLAKLNKI